MRSNKSALLPRKIGSKLGWLVGATTALTAAIGLGAWVRVGATTTTPSNVFAESGYFEKVPPSTLNGPGTFNTVQLLDNGRVHLNQTCNTGSFAPLLASNILESETIDHQVVQSIKKRQNTSDQIKSIIASTASEVGISEAKSISLSLANTRILQMTDEGLLAIRKAMLRGDCEEAVIKHLSDGGMVCQTIEVLEADAVYEIKDNDEVSAEQQARFKTVATAKIAMTANQGSTDRSSGRRLYFGIRLAPIGLVLNRADAKPVDCPALPRA